MKAIALVIPLALLGACSSFDTLFAPEDESNVVQKAVEEKNALQRGPAVQPDLGPGQSSMLTQYVETKEENKKLKQDMEGLQNEILSLQQELSRSESERMQERSDKLTAQAQVSAKEKEYREALARILDLQITRSRLQQKVYLLSLAGREKEISDQLRAGQGLAPSGSNSKPGHE